MRKVKALTLFIIFFFSSVNYHNLLAKNNISNLPLGCSSELTKSFFLNYYNLSIKKIEIDTHNYRNWTVNNVRIITHNTRFIPNNLKKRFDATIKVTFEDDSFCILTGRVRHSGDAKDHIALKGNSIIQSLDVILNYGNIKGITKFKLFKPDVRGNLEDVIIQTNLLRELGYLAPRSKKVLARVNETESVMLFQEKAAKELLEFNNRREGPILEGDQKYFFELVKDIPDDNKSNWSVGTPFLRNKSMKVMLTKSTNSKVIEKGDVHKEIFLKTINNLNLIYLYWANRFQDDKNNYFFFDYDLDNELLGLFDKSNIIRLEKYNLLMQATNSQHALGPDARKFYWNAVENLFEPINYDANPEIDRETPTTTTASYRLPISTFYEDSFLKLEKDLDKINLLSFNKGLKVHGLILTDIELEKKINKIKKNLSKIKSNYLETDNNELILHNKFKPIDNVLSKFNENIKDIDSEVLLVKFNKNYQLEKCKVAFKNCEKLVLNSDQFADLLEGELKIDKKNFQFVGQNFDLNSLKKKSNYKNKISVEKTNIFFEDGIEVKIDENLKNITIKQTELGSKVYLIDGNLDNYTIDYTGLSTQHIQGTNNPKLLPPKYPIDTLGLTGCVSLINLKLTNLIIKANNSNCEDTINIINSSGNIESVNIENSFSDALDVDFSNVSFNKIKISNAINDCVDFSYGDYILKNLELNNCGDKGLSIGEKSKVDLENINIQIANIGVATKDSSVLNLKDASISDSNICISAYKKKQEFMGGYVEIDELNCLKSKTKTSFDKFSKIYVKNNKSIN